VPIAEDNPIYQLAMKGLAGQEARLSSLLMYIEGLEGLWAGESPLDGRSYEELVEWLDDLKAEEHADFRCYLALMTFMVAAAWDERYSAPQAAIALSSCERASASVLHLAGLRKLANAFTDNLSFELRSLTAGLTGLFELVSLMQTHTQTHGQTHLCRGTAPTYPSRFLKKRFGAWMQGSPIPPTKAGTLPCSGCWQTFAFRARNFLAHPCAHGKILQR
jgi:hypothetical protein